MNTKTKKGFTLTELIIVVVIIGVLAAVLIPTLTACVKKAKISNDKQLVRNLNLALKNDEEYVISGNKHEHMQAALDAAFEAGYDVSKINATKYDNEILWDSENDVFCYLNDGDVEYIPDSISGVGLEANDYRLWKISKTVDANYSTYYIGEETTIYTSKGFDAGTNTNITAINYTNSGSVQHVIIRTNGGVLTIAGYVDSTNNKIGDTVKHYGDSEKVDVISIANASYHENGTVKLIAVKAGHIKLEGNAEVNGIYVYNDTTYDENGNVILKDDKFKEVKITVDAGVDVPKLSRSAVEIDDEGTKVCTVVTDQAKDVYLFNEGIYEQIKTVDEGKPITDSSAKWADDNSANTANTQTAAQQLANEWNGAASPTWNANDTTREIENITNKAAVAGLDENDYEDANELAAAIEEVWETKTAVTESGQSVEAAQAANALKGSGTQVEPYLIYNLNDFQKCEALSEKSSQVLYFKVMEDFTNDDTNWTTWLFYADLDLNGHTINLSSAAALLSVRNEVKVHNGTFNWNGGTSNIATINQSEAANVKATFDNLNLTGRIITNATHFGPITSYLYAAAHKGIYEINANKINNNLTIIDQNGDVGGLFGYIQGSKITASITNCTFAGSAQGSQVGGFFNCTSYPEAKPIVNSGNSVTGKLTASSTVRAFGLNGNYNPLKPDSTEDSLDAQNALVDSTSGSLITLVESATLLTIDSMTKEISVNYVEGASYYIVEIEYWVTRNSDGSGGYPRTIQVRLDEAGNSGLKQLDFVQVNDEPNSSVKLLDFEAAKVWEENGEYKIYDSYFSMYHNTTNWYIRAYAYDTNDTLKAFQTTKR